MAKWEDITDDLTDWAKQSLEVGQVLVFDFEGSPLQLKIMRKRYDRVWAKEVHLMSIEEFKEWAEQHKKEVFQKKK